MATTSHHALIRHQYQRSTLGMSTPAPSVPMIQVNIWLMEPAAKGLREALAATTFADQGNRLAGMDMQVKILQDCFFVRIAEPHIFETHIAS